MVFLITRVVFLSNVCHLWLLKYSGVVLGLKFDSLPSDICAGGRGFEPWPVQYSES